MVPHALITKVSLILYDIMQGFYSSDKSKFKEFPRTYLPLFKDSLRRYRHEKIEVNQGKRKHL